MTTLIKRKPPTKTEVLKELVAVRKEQMEKANEELRKARESYNDELEKDVLQYFLDNITSFKKDAFGVHLSLYHNQVAFRFARPLDESEELEHPKLPLELYTRVQKLYEMPREKYRDHEMTDSAIRKKLKENMEKVNPKSVVDATKSSDVERTPVVREYLEEFLTAFTQTTEAVDRLSAA